MTEKPKSKPRNRLLAGTMRFELGEKHRPATEAAKDLPAASQASFAFASDLAFRSLSLVSVTSSLGRISAVGPSVVSGSLGGDIAPEVVSSGAQSATEISKFM